MLTVRRYALLRVNVLIVIAFFGCSATSRRVPVAPPPTTALPPSASPPSAPPAPEPAWTEEPVPASEAAQRAIERARRMLDERRFDEAMELLAVTLRAHDDDVALRILD